MPQNTASSGLWPCKRDVWGHQNCHWPYERQNRLARSSLIRACSCSVGWSIISSSTQPRTLSQTLTWVASHRGLAWQHANTRRAQHSHRRSRLWQGTGEEQYPAGIFEAWEANHPATASWAPLPVLGARSYPPKHERCQHSLPVQHRQTLRKNQSLRGAHTGAAVCRRRCFNIPQRGGPPTSGRQAVPCLQGVWANDQPQEDQHPGTRCWVPPSHHHRQLGAGGCGHLHLLGLHHVKLDFARCWDQLQDRQSSCCHGQTQQTSVGQWPVEWKYQDLHLPSLCPVGSPLWQRVVDDLCQTRAATQRIPPPLPLAPAAHQVAGQSHQHRVPGVRWLGEHAITAHSATPSMSQPSKSHGAWPPAKRNPLWRTAGGRLWRRSTSAALQGRHLCMGGHHQTPRYMAAKCQSGGFKGGSEC